MRPVRRDREARTLAAMVRLYCRAHHATGNRVPCGACQRLQEYALECLGRCVHGERKPVCNRCTVHCYAPAQREQIRRVMRFGGPRMLLHHPWMALAHLIDMLRPVRRLQK